MGTRYAVPRRYTQIRMGSLGIPIGVNKRLIISHRGGHTYAWVLANQLFASTIVFNLKENTFAKWLITTDLRFQNRKPPGAA